MTLYQKVRRRALRLIVVDKKSATPVPEAVEVLACVDTELSSLTSGRSVASAATHTDDEDAAVANLLAIGNPANSVRRCLLVDSDVGTPSDETTTASSAAADSEKKRYRRTSKDLQRHNSKIAAMKARHSRAMKAATRLVVENNKLEKDDNKRQSIEKIVEQTNATFNSNIHHKTVGRYVSKGYVGMSPMKKGPSGEFTPRIYTALKGAWATYLKLEQAGSKKQSTLKQMSKLVNATINKSGSLKTRDDLAKKLQRDTADQFNVGKANVVEQRRLQWTTTYNLDVWFTSWKDLLIDLGFAREKEPADVDVEGELVFFPGQLERIGNIDETDGSIDETSGQRGGRPAMTLFAPEVAGGATAINKSGYSSTIICGSNAAGEPFPPHFQLKTKAQTDEGQRLSVDWFTSTKDVIAKFGFPERRAFPCTFGMNDKGRMNSVELDKYIKNSILPLYPNIADIPLKRVALKVDSGPGRMMLKCLQR